MEDRRISRRHVEISMRGNDFFITDLGSRNGTYLGETQLSPDSPFLLSGMQTIRLGSQTFIELEPLRI
jgi:pSer/pThr/pTyr-binding forkhead associated (FHA) protein